MTRRVVGSMALGLWRLVRERRFDVVVCYGYRAASFWIAAAAARSTGARLVWSTDANRLAPRGDDLGVSAKAKLKRLLLPLVFRTGDAVFGASSQSLAFLRSIGVRGPHTFLMPFVVDNAFFEDGAARIDPGDVRRSWEVPPDAFVVLFSGKIVAWKRPQDVLAAAARIPDAWVVFAGDGPLRQDLARRADVLGIGDRVRFLGFVNQSSLPGTYRAADVLVLPSSFEPFGLVVNEAFASGIPAICTMACGAAGDLIRDGETGFTYPSGDVDALSGLLRRVSVDPELRVRLARGARARIGEWGVEENAEAFIRAVRTIAGGRP
jgi:glycosyltransferase involved in cell wall biosynthesis